MGRIYKVPLNVTSTASTVRDLVSFLAEDDTVVRILGFDISQASINPLSGEETQFYISMGRITAVGSGGTGSITPVPLDPGDAAASFSSRTGDTTAATQSVQLYGAVLNALAGHEYAPIPDAMPWISGGSGVSINVTNNSGGPTIGFLGNMYIEEIG